MITVANHPTIIRSIAEIERIKTRLAQPQTKVSDKKGSNK